MTKITVRSAKTEDASAIVELLKQLHPRFPADPARSSAVIAEILAMPGRNLLVATRGDEIVGTADVLVVPNLTHGGRPWSTVENVVVDASHRGSGIGKALLIEACRCAADAGSYMVQLLSLHHRIDAHAFYRSLGFEAVAEGFRLYLGGFAPTTADDQ